MKKLLSLVLTFCVCLSCIPTAFAEGSATLSSSPSITGIQATSLDTVLEYENGEHAVITNVQIDVQNNCINLYGLVTPANGVPQNLNTTGTVYRFRSASGKDTYLLDFDDTEGIHFVQARLDEELNQPQLLLVLQFLENEEYLAFEIPLATQSNLESIKAIAITNDNQTAFSLYNLSHNILDPDTSTIKVSGSSDSEVSVMIIDGETLLPQARASYNTTVDNDDWEEFFTALEDDGTANIGDYDIDTRILNTGWVFLNNSTAYTGKYSLACYTTQNGSYEKLIQLTFLDIVHQSSSPTYASLQMKIGQTISLSYNEITEEFDVLYYNWGPYIDNLNLALTLPGGTSSTTVFISRQLKANLSDDPDTLKSIIAFIPYASTVYDVWNILTESGEDTALDTIDSFEDTYDKQYREYNKNVCRVIAGSTGNHELDRIGDNFYIRGDIYAGYEDCSGWKYEYSATHI